LAIDEKALGRDHPDVAGSLNNLALLYGIQGRYAEAEPLYQRSLAIYEKALGHDHPNVATALNNLAALYDSQGRYADAEPLYQHSVVLRDKRRQDFRELFRVGMRARPCSTGNSSPWAAGGGEGARRGQGRRHGCRDGRLHGRGASAM